MTQASQKAPVRADAAGAALLGRRILVVEDDFIVAADLCRGLADLGATVLGPAPTPFYALALLGRRSVDIAVLDIRLHGQDVFDVAEELTNRGIPIVFATAMSAETLPPAFRHWPIVHKPIDPHRLHALLAEALIRDPAPNLQVVSASPEHDDDRLMRAIVKALRVSTAPTS